jgi:hypothetical protein
MNFCNWFLQLVHDGEVEVETEGQSLQKESPCRRRVKGKLTKRNYSSGRTSADEF